MQYNVYMTALAILSIMKWLKYNVIFNELQLRTETGTAEATSTQYEHWQYSQHDSVLRSCRERADEFIKMPYRIS